MSTGPDDPAGRDADPLDYPAPLSTGDAAVDRWRVLCNFAERADLLATYGRSLIRRHDGLASALSDQVATLEDMGRALERAARHTAPEAGEIESRIAADNAARAGWQAAARTAFWDDLAPGREVRLADQAAEVILDGFHPAEPGGRWTGAAAEAKIWVPFDRLAASGASHLGIALDHIDLFAPQDVRLRADPEGATLPLEVDQATGTLTVAIAGVPAGSDRLIVTTPETRRHGADPRNLGCFLISLTVVHDAG